LRADSRQEIATQIVRKSAGRGAPTGNWQIQLPEFSTRVTNLAGIDLLFNRLSQAQT
jgi:hypothetical protein